MTVPMNKMIDYLVVAGMINGKDLWLKTELTNNLDKATANKYIDRAWSIPKDISAYAMEVFSSVIRGNLKGLAYTDYEGYTEVASFIYDRFGLQIAPNGVVTDGSESRLGG